MGVTSKDGNNRLNNPSLAIGNSDLSNGNPRPESNPQSSCPAFVPKFSKVDNVTKIGSESIKSSDLNVQTNTNFDTNDNSDVEWKRNLGIGALLTDLDADISKCSNKRDSINNKSGIKSGQSIKSNNLSTIMSAKSSTKNGNSGHGNKTSPSLDGQSSQGSSGLKMKIKRKDGTRTSHVKHEVVAMNENGCDNGSLGTIGGPVLGIKPIGALDNYPPIGTPLKSSESGLNVSKPSKTSHKKKVASPVTSEYILDNVPSFTVNTNTPPVINAPTSLTSTLINNSLINSPSPLINNGNHHLSIDPSTPLKTSISSPSASPKDSPISKTRSIGTCTSEGTITEPECLGPCEPGTSVTLEGIVWQETEGGLLVVNVTWREKSYVGTLLDCTKHDWAPPPPDSPSDEASMDQSIKSGRGVRGKRGGREPSNIETRGGGGSSSKLRGGRGKGKSSHFQIPASPVEKRKQQSIQRSNSESTESNPVVVTCPSPAKRSKRDDGLIECPEPNCNKKYKHINGLKYHQTHAHKEAKESSDGNSEQTEEGDEPNPSTTPSDSIVAPDGTDGETVMGTDGGDMTDHDDGMGEEMGEGRSRSPSPVYSDISEDEPDSNHNQDSGSTTNDSRNGGGHDSGGHDGVSDSGSGGGKNPPRATSFQPLFSPLTSGTTFGQNNDNNSNCSRSQDSISNDSTSNTNSNSNKLPEGASSNPLVQLRYPYSYSIAGSQVFAPAPPGDSAGISPVLISSESLTPNQLVSSGMKTEVSSIKVESDVSKVSPDPMKGGKKLGEEMNQIMESNGQPPVSTASYFLHPSFPYHHHPSASGLMAAGHPFDPTALAFRGPMVGGPSLFLPPHLAAHATKSPTHPSGSILSPGSVPLLVPDLSLGSKGKGGDSGSRSPKSGSSEASPIKGGINQSQGSGGGGGGGGGGGEGRNRESPPPQRHLHTHHHTHVGVGYPLPVAYDPFGVMASSQQAAAVISPFVTPKT